MAVAAREFACLRGTSTSPETHLASGLDKQSGVLRPSRRLVHDI
jgi:hypothetical protein